jgi:hypothetical protein
MPLTDQTFLLLLHHAPPGPSAVTVARKMTADVRTLVEKNVGKTTTAQRESKTQDHIKVYPWGHNGMVSVGRSTCTARSFYCPRR